MGNSKHNIKPISKSSEEKSSLINSKMISYLNSKKILTMNEIDNNRIRVYQPILK
jgi:hypothetical protein